MTGNLRSETYYAADTDETLGRLIRASDLIAPDVRDAFHRTDIQPGDRIIEVGCGPLGALRELSDLVGPQGTVVGVDLDQRSLQRARAILDQAGRENVRLVHADINADAPDELRRLGPFDAAYSRFFLMHQADPVATLRRVAALLRPGGYIVAHEPVLDTPLPRSEPDVPEIEQVWRWIRNAGLRRGSSQDVARHFHTVCRQAGLREASQRLFGAVVSRDARYWIKICQDTLLAGRPALLQYDIASEEEIHVVIGRLIEAERWEFEALFALMLVELETQVPPAG
jgi:SAM-dependent methyltransferase